MADEPAPPSAAPPAEADPPSAAVDTDLHDYDAEEISDPIPSTPAPPGPMSFDDDMDEAGDVPNSSKLAQSERLLRRKAGGDGGDGESAYLARQVALDDLCKACRGGDVEAAFGVLDERSYMVRMSLDVNAASATSGAPGVLARVAQ